MNVVIDLAVSYVQFLTASLSLPDIQLPDIFKKAMNILSSIKIDTAIVSEWWPALKDIRVYFTILCVVIPLLFIFAGLVFLNEKRVVIWYLFLLIGCMMVAAGGFGRAIVATAQLPLTAEQCQWMMYIGGGLVGICLLILLIYRNCCTNSNDEDDEEYKDTSEMDKIEAQSCHCMTSLQSLILFIVGSGVVVLMLGYITPILKDKAEAVGSHFSIGFAAVAGVVALWNLIWFLMSLAECGRAKQIAIVEWVHSRFVYLFLLVLTFVYIPIGAGIFLMFNCNSFKCGSGWRLPDDGSVVYFDSVALSDNYCQTCTIATGQTCPSSLQSSICGGMTDDRLEYSVSVQCNSVRQFFWPAAFLCIAMFCLGVPMMFYFIIKRAAQTIHDNFPLFEVPCEEGENIEHVSWLRKVVITRCIVRFLFQPFQFEYRYVRLWQFFHKFLIVGTTSYVVRSSISKPQTLSLGAAAIIHFVAFLLYLIHKPYVHKQQSYIAIAMGLMLCLSCILMIMVLQGYGIPDTAVNVMLLANGVLPALAIGMGFYLDCARSSADEEKQAKEEQERIAARLGALAANTSVVVGSPMRHVGAPPASSSPKSPQEPPRSAVYAGITMPSDIIPHAVPETTEYTDGQANKRKRAAKLAQLRDRAEDDIKKEMEQEIESIEAKQHDVDTFVNRNVKSQMQKFLMIGGILGFLALGCAVLGLIATQSSSVLEPFPSSKTTTTELATYSDWSSFTSACCCLAYNNTASESSYLYVEKWICANGKIKERVRVESSTPADISGLSIRSMCNTTFEAGPGCSVSVVSNNVVLTCTTPGALTVDQLKLW